MEEGQRTLVLLPEPIHSTTRTELESEFDTCFLQESADPVGLLSKLGPRVRALARGNHIAIDRSLMERLPALEIVAVFGAGYDRIDLDYARKRGIIVTNTPGVLSEEVADFTIALLIMTLRDLLGADRYLRSGGWAAMGKFPPSWGSLRDRKVGVLGLGRIGEAVARRLDAMQVPVAYHTRTPREVPYRYYSSPQLLAADVDTLIVVLPGGESTRKIVDARVLEALGPRGVLINVGRGSTVDEPALIEALANRTIQAAGLDVYENEPDISPDLLALDNAVLLPHVGSASMATHDAMGRLLVQNLRNWFERGKPLTPVAETPWPMVFAR
jgi:lactate dehydrogenase-like 2-hydroxyacid dehydrogenase